MRDFVYLIAEQFPLLYFIISIKEKIKSTICNIKSRIVLFIFDSVVYDKRRVKAEKETSVFNWKELLLAGNKLVSFEVMCLVPNGMFLKKKE